MPYERDEIADAVLSDMCTRDRLSWRSMCPMIFFNVVEVHNPLRVMRQFGRWQDVPPIFLATNVAWHK
jgi:hypothetical protein